MKRFALALVCLAALVAGPALAAQPRCPLDVETCLAAFERMRHRPFVGVLLDQDSSGVVTVTEVVPGGPAEKAGMRVGDVLIQLNGVPISDAPKLIVGKAGWKTGTKVRYRVHRGEVDQDVALTLGQITDEQLARMIGEHMVEGHLAYAGTETSQVH